MASNRTKKIFLILSVVVPFLLYCVYYYSMMVKNAPYKFADFQSLKFQYGFKDSILNKFDSNTGDYQYLNKRDSLVKMNLKFTKDDLLYLHRKAAELGFWDFPSNERGDSTTKVHAPRYIMEFHYKKKSKQVTFDANYEGPEKLMDANQRLIKEIQSKLNEVEERQKK